MQFNGNFCKINISGKEKTFKIIVDDPSIVIKDADKRGK